MPRITIRLATAVVGLVAIIFAASVGMNSSSRVLAAGNQVQIADMAFQPGNLTITVGDTVTWTNADDRPHTVTADDGAFDSGNIDEGASHSFTFTEPGTYTYHCGYHSEMRATIVVVAAAQAPAAAPPAAPPATGGHAGHAAGAGNAGSGDQPDTALPAPSSIPGLSFVLWGLGLIVLGATVLPARRMMAIRTERPGGGWRR
jgi:plastocyanin